MSGLVNAGYQGSNGSFSYLDDNATPFNTEDDQMTTRSNNRFDAWNGLGSLTWRPHAELAVTARGDWLAKHQGTPGLGAIPTLHTRLASVFGLGQLEAVLAARGAARPRIALSGSMDRSVSRFHDPDAELGLGTHDTDDRMRADHLDLELEWARLPWTLGLEAGGTLRREGAELHDAADGFADPPPSRRERRGGMLGLSLRPFSGRLHLHAAERWDRLDDALRSLGAGGVPGARDVSRSLRSPQLGAKLEVGLGLELRTNGSKADRPPDFMELFGNQGMVLGNVALEPERLENWDAGGSWTAPARSRVRATITWDHFESRARNLILYTRTSPSTVKAQNVSAAKVGGEELGVEAGVGPVKVAGSFTWQNAIDAGDVPYWTGKRLPQRPGREGYAQLVWERGALRLGGDVYYLGDNYLDRYNRYWIGTRTLTGAWVSISPRGWPLRLSLEGKNLGDRRAADVSGYPLPSLRRLHALVPTSLDRGPRAGGLLLAATARARHRCRGRHPGVHAHQRLLDR